MSMEKYEVMGEFLRIANEQNLLGLKKTAAPEKNPRQEDLKTIEEKRPKPTETIDKYMHIMEKAHPESVYIAEARGDGALVENNLEQQKKLIQMINKMPTGSLVGRYASAIIGFKKMADDCDNIGMPDAADVLTDLTVEFIRMASKEHCEKCGGYGFITNPKVSSLGPAADWYVDCQSCRGRTRDLQVAQEQDPNDSDEDKGCSRCGGSGRDIGPSKMDALHPHMMDSPEDLDKQYDHGECKSCMGKSEGDLPLT